MYKPEPINTKGIDIPEDLKPLVELIAKNVHEVWAKSRVEQGWTYGEVKDSIKKTTPCLVPYEQLSEEEKDYDRHTALETLKVVLKHGYKIEK
jgi:ryanodine receptor 2